MVINRAAQGLGSLVQGRRLPARRPRTAHAARRAAFRSPTAGQHPGAALLRHHVGEAPVVAEEASAVVGPPSQRARAVKSPRTLPTVTLFEVAKPKLLRLVRLPRGLWASFACMQQGDATSAPLPLIDCYSLETVDTESHSCLARNTDGRDGFTGVAWSGLRSRAVAGQA